MKIVGIIPARYASTRFEGKPLADICGKPMIWWVYQQAKKAKLLNEVIVATDHKDIFDTCKSLDISVMMTSENNNTSLERIYEVSTRRKSVDVFVSINGDEPLLNPHAIDKIIESFMKHQEYWVVNAMKDIDNPVDVIDWTNLKIVTNDIGECVYISRTPIPFPKASTDFKYKKFVGITLLQTQALQFYHNTERGKLEGIEDCDSIRFLEHQKVMKFIDVQCESVSVDTPKDLERVRNIISIKVSKGEL